MKLVKTKRPIMPQSEHIFYVVDITPSFGYEVVFSGTADKCIKWQSDNGRGKIPLYQQVEIDEDMITSIQSKTMIDVVSNHRQCLPNDLMKHMKN